MSQDSKTRYVRTPFLGVGFDNICFEEVCRTISSHLETRKPGYMMSLNVDIVVRADRDASFHSLLEEADLVLMDSVPLMRIARWKGIEVKEKLSGSDLMPRICDYAAELGLSCYFLGGAEGIPERAAKNLTEQCPGLRIAGTLSPEYGFEKDSRIVSKVVSRVAEAKADILFVCLGEPKASTFIASNIEEMGVPFSLSIGAAIDFAAGSAKRAPAWMQRVGLEWFYRFCREPKRLFRRYFVDSWRLLHLILGYPDSRNQ